MADRRSALGDPPSKAAPAEWAGTWRGRGRSILTLRVSGQMVTGEYVCDAGGPDAGSGGKVAGSVDGDMISFVVSWNDYRSLIAWTGQRVGPHLNALWLLVRDAADGDAALGLWRSCNTGAEEFTKIA